jgi:hypothetical protein
VGEYSIVFARADEAEKAPYCPTEGRAVLGMGEISLSPEGVVPVPKRLSKLSLTHRLLADYCKE